MAIPKTRQQLFDYVMRALGRPVIEINMSDDQVEDAIDDALQFWREYHYNGTEHSFLAQQVEQADIDNGYLTLPDVVCSVVDVFDITDNLQRSSTSLFNIEYQLRLHDLWDISSTDITYYFMAKNYISLINDVLNPPTRYDFNQHQNKLVIHLDWNTRMTVGMYVMAEVYKYVDPETTPEIYGDRVLKALTVEYARKRWGQNMSKFQNVELPGGVTMNGDKIVDMAEREIEKLEQDFIMRYSEPDDFIVG